MFSLQKAKGPLKPKADIENSDLTGRIRRQLLAFTYRARYVLPRDAAKTVPSIMKYITSYTLEHLRYFLEVHSLKIIY